MRKVYITDYTKCRCSSIHFIQTNIISLTCYKTGVNYVLSETSLSFSLYRLNIICYKWKLYASFLFAFVQENTARIYPKICYSREIKNRLYNMSRKMFTFWLQQKYAKPSKYHLKNPIYDIKEIEKKKDRSLLQCFAYIFVFICFKDN